MRNLTIILTLLGLAACSEPAEPPAPQAYDQDADVIGAPLHEALDKAGGVEDLLAGGADGIAAGIAGGHPRLAAQRGDRGAGDVRLGHRRGRHHHVGELLVVAVLGGADVLALVRLHVEQDRVRAIFLRRRQYLPSEVRLQQEEA